MGKNRVNVTIDEHILKKAKERGISISHAAEEGIRNKSGGIEVSIRDGEICDNCKKKEKRAFIDKSGTFYDGMSWIYPDEVWLCSDCFKNTSEMNKNRAGGRK